MVPQRHSEESGRCTAMAEQKFLAAIRSQTAFLAEREQEMTTQAACTPRTARMDTSKTHTGVKSVGRQRVGKTPPRPSRTGLLGTRTPVHEGLDRGTPFSSVLRLGLHERSDGTTAGQGQGPTGVDEAYSLVRAVVTRFEFVYF